MSKSEYPQNPHLQQAARLREQQGKQALKDGDKARAHEQFRKAAADYIGAGDLEGSVRCLAKSGEVAESIGKLLKVFDAQDVVAKLKKNFEDSLELGLCLLAAAVATHDYKRFSAKSVLQKVAKGLSAAEALQALKGSALAADWENNKAFLKKLCPVLRLKMQEMFSQASDDSLRKKLLVEEICVISGQMFLSGDFTSLTDIDEKQMQYLNLKGEALSDPTFIRTLFPMFLARDVGLGDLIAAAKRHSAISNIAEIYERLRDASSENDLKSAIQRIESLVIESHEKVMQKLVVHSWDDIGHAFDGIKYFSPEVLTLTILHQQYQDHVAALKSLNSRLLNCTERFSKGEYDKVSRELDSCMTDTVFLDLPSEYRANILTIAGKCAYELEEWEALDGFVGLLEADYELENALPKILEA